MSLTVLILLVGAASSDPNKAAIPLDLDAVAGFYEQPAVRCATGKQGSRPRCADGVTDRLVIERLGPTQARIVVHSHQLDGHQCHVDGIATLHDGRLRYCLEYEPGTCLSIVEGRTALSLEVTIEGDYYVPFCGSRASLDGLRYLRSARLSPRRCRD